MASESVDAVSKTFDSSVGTLFVVTKKIRRLKLAVPGFFRSYKKPRVQYVRMLEVMPVCRPTHFYWANADCFTEIYA